MRGVLILLAGWLLAGTASAVVLGSKPEGFAVKESEDILAPSDVVWARLTKPSLWWSSDHTFGRSAANLTLNARPGGEWLETLPSGGVVHMTVVYVDAPRVLRLEGALGPMQSMGVSGHLTITLQPRGAATHLEAVYMLGGYTPEGLLGMAPVVDRVLGEQFDRLKSVSETAPR